MAGWATVEEVRSLVYTVKPDTEIQSILNIARMHIEAKVGTVLAPFPVKVGIAHLYFSIASLLRDMQTNGEMAYYNKQGPNQTYNEIEPAIAHYMRLYEEAIRGYSISNIKSLSGLYGVIKNSTEQP